MGMTCFISEVFLSTSLDFDVIICLNVEDTSSRNIQIKKVLLILLQKYQKVLSIGIPLKYLNLYSLVCNLIETCEVY